MSRLQTKGAIDEMFHVYNRGVDKRTIFTDKKDYLRFYESLYYFNTVEPVTNISFAKIQDYKDVERLVDIYAYCLLPNHFHLLLKQKTDNGVGEFMRRLSGGYTSYFNGRHDRSGVLFQGVYKRSLVDSDEYLNYLFAYINENYAVHDLKLPEEICYSSTFHYQNVAKSKVIHDCCKQKYNFAEAQKLAKQIYKIRKEYKIFLE